MLASLYIKEYYTWLKGIYEKEGLPIGNEFPTFVPTASIEAMMSFTGRKYFYDRDNKDLNECPKQPSAFIGFHRAAINKDTRRPNFAIRGKPGLTGATSRQMVYGEFLLTTFIVTNDNRLAEDFEEIYNVIVRDISVIPINIDIIHEQDFSEFRLNTFHGEVTSSAQETEMGNIWGVEMVHRIMGPLFQLDKEEKELARKLSICLYTDPATITGKVERLNDLPQ